MEAAKETIKKNLDTYKIPPIRSMSDFLLNGSRYSVPALSDLRKFNNRMVCNLMYYQTNYFLISVTIFIIFMISGLKTLICGIISAGVIAGSVLFVLGKIPNAQNYKADHPAAVVTAGVALLATLYFAIKAIMFVMLAVLIPLPLWFLHATMRMRNWKNKVTNKMEKIGCSGLSNSPMGVLLHKVLGCDVKEIIEGQNED